MAVIFYSFYPFLLLPVFQCRSGQVFLASNTLWLATPAYQSFYLAVESQSNIPLLLPSNHSFPNQPVRDGLGGATPRKLLWEWD